MSNDQIENPENPSNFMTLRVPRIIYSSTQAFPPVDITQQTLPGAATPSQPVVVDCFNSTPRLWALLISPSPLLPSSSSFICFRVPAILGSPCAAEEAPTPQPGTSQRRSSLPTTQRERSNSVPDNNRNASRVLFREPENMPGPSSRANAEAAPISRRPIILTANAPTGIVNAARSPHRPLTVPQLPSAPVADWRSLVRVIRTPEVPLPTFVGMDHEDPEAFLSLCEHYYFAAASIKPSLRSRMAIKSFCDFAGVSALNNLHIKLYATKQEKKEVAEVFLQIRYLLALCLLPQAPRNR